MPDLEYNYTITSQLPNQTIPFYTNKNKMTRMHVMELCTVTKHIGNHTEFTLQKTENWMTFWSTVMTMQWLKQILYVIYDRKMDILQLSK